MNKITTLFLATLVVVILSSKIAWSLHTVVCFRFPPPFDDELYAKSGSPDLSSVGMEKFPQNPKFWHKYLVSAFAVGDDSPNGSKTIGFHDTELVKISVHTILGRTSGSTEPLNGWYRVEVKALMPGKFAAFFRSFVLYAHDEQMNVVGQFVHDFPTSKKEYCPPNDATPYMLISCGGTWKSEPFTSNAVVFVRNNTAADGDHWPKAYKKYWPIVPEHVHSKMNFYYRYSFQDANRPSFKFLMFRLIVDPDENYDFVGKHGLGINKYDLERTLFSTVAILMFKEKAVAGAVDPLPTQAEQLACDNPMLGGVNSNYRDENWQWYIQRFINTVRDDRAYTQYALGAANYVPQHYSCNGRFFGGRCVKSNCEVYQGNPHANREAASLNVIPQWDSIVPNGPYCYCGGLANFWACFNKDKHNAPKEFNNKNTLFHECKAHLTEILKTSECPASNTKTGSCNITAIRQPHSSLSPGGGAKGNGANGNGMGSNLQDKNALMKKIVNQRGIRVYGMGTVLYAVRKGHGMAMSIAMFCIPLLIFTSRYYKETFMSSRIFYTRVWFQMHIQLVFWIFVFYFGGLVLAFSGRAVLGVSLTGAGVAHRVVGWMSVILFIFIAITGGIRWFEDPGRSYTICIHWVLGWLLYILNVTAMLLSIEIPGSPISDHDESIFDDQDEPIINKAHIVILGWVLVDVIVHVIMTLSIYSYDRWMDVIEPRMFIPAKVGVPIPVVKESIQDDVPGSGFRTLMFWLYVGILVLFCLGVCTIIIAMTANTTKGFGPMTCTHDPETNELLKNIDSSCT